LKERAEALGRAGERLFAVLKELKKIEESIHSKLETIQFNNDGVEAAVREI
ncbi:unnamed protein product, partial [marine sediment metagenome]